MVLVAFYSQVTAALTASGQYFVYLPYIYIGSLCRRSQYSKSSHIYSGQGVQAANTQINFFVDHVAWNKPSQPGDFQCISVISELIVDVYMCVYIWISN